MYEFIHNDFMLQNDLAKKLYHQFVKDLPIIDYHCHLDPKLIYENKQFASIGELWLGADHYKWRLMRAFGFDETLVTGEASFSDKFKAYAELLPNLIGNPVFHWSQLELKRYFGIDDLLSLENHAVLEEKANTILADLNPKKVMDQFKVELIGTTDDPLDDLVWHAAIADDVSFKTHVLPTFRPDRVVNIEQESFISWLLRLEEIIGHPITSLQALKNAMQLRLDYFVKHGSFIADHALDLIVYSDNNDQEVDGIFKKRLNQEALSLHEIAQYKSNLLVFFGQAYHQRKIVMQYHIGASRNNNSLQFNVLGADTGFDAVQDQPIVLALKGLLDALSARESLPKTIIYSVNQNDYDVIVPLMQCYQGEEKGKIQFGSAWWFQDNLDGMRRQMRAYMSNGVFSTFIGMLTDSRSFLSYPRHEYFRRLLCQLISEEVMNGYYPNDEKRLAEIVQNISYYNAKKYFNR